ncbi:Peptidase M50 [Syntrophobacter sp. SbD1]|nr:Peptidase M50 [Syntrophobacter sp. SbD1]
MTDVPKILLSIVPLLFAIILHEVSHGWVAEKLGDPTARMMGRITLNPISHIDPLGTIILPGILLLTGSHFLFGWAKPVPVNFSNLRGGRRDMALVALSGPLSNFVLAVLSSIIFHLTLRGFMSSGGALDMVIVPIHLMAQYSVLYNLVLMAINLLPILPLDGGRIVAGLAPEQVAISMERMERYGMLIVLLLIASGIWSYLVSPVIYVFWRILM